jgi:colicin import membrane protein
MNAAMTLDRPPEPGKWVSLAATVAMHLLLVIVLVYGIRWQTSPPAPVQVELVSAASLARPLPVVEPRPEPKVEPRVEPKPEPKPLAKPDIAIKKEPEKPKPKVEPKPEPKPEIKPEPKKDVLMDKLNQEMAKLSQNKAAAKMDQELARFKADQALAASGRALASYTDKIRAKIRGNLIRVADLSGNPEAEFDVTQLPSGEVLSATLRKSSGNAALDAAIERAINKSSPLPKPDDPGLFQRNLRLKFRPFEE